MCCGRMAQSKVGDLTKLSCIDPEGFAAVADGNIFVGSQKDLELEYSRITANDSESISGRGEIERWNVVNFDNIGTDVLVPDVSNPRG